MPDHSTPRHCLAPDCGTVLVQRADERPARFRERKTCSSRCRYRLTAATRRDNLPDTRSCPRCEADLPPRHIYRSAYCHSCFAEYMRTRYVPRPARPHSAEGYKRCSACKQELPLAEFARSRAKHDGRNDRCRQCMAAAYQRNKHRYAEREHAYYKTNAKRIVAKSAEWAKENPERRKAIRTAFDNRNKDNARVYRELHRADFAIYFREWKRQNKERFSARRREYEARRRAWKYGGTAERIDYLAVLALHGPTCHICGENIDVRIGRMEQDGLTFDHVVPLAKGGSHTADNLKPAHRRCNVRKGARIIVGNCA